MRQFARSQARCAMAPAVHPEHPTVPSSTKAAQLICVGALQGALTTQALCCEHLLPEMAEDGGTPPPGQPTKIRIPGYRIAAATTAKSVEAL